MSHRYSFLICALLLISNLVIGRSAQAVPFTANGSQQHQTIDGFGVNINTGWWNNGEVVPALDMLTDDLGAKIFRSVIEESDWEVTNDNSDPNVFNWTYYNQIFSGPRFQGVWETLRYLNNKGIREDGLVISLMGRPPTWMGPNETVTTAMEDELVETVAALFYYARHTQGIQFRYVSAFNEADMGGAEGPSMQPAQFARVYRKLADKLDTIGMSDIRFSGPDAVLDPPEYFNPMAADSVVVGKMAHWATHMYNYGDMSWWINLIQANTPGKKAWVSETAEFYNVMWQVDTGANAVLIWDGFDSVYQHAIRVGRGDQPPNDSVGIEWPLIAYDTATHLYTPRKAFYENAQLMKFVSPGAVRIGSTDNESTLEVIAFRNPGGQIVIVGNNTTSSPMTVEGTLSNLNVGSSMRFYQTNATMNLQQGANVPVASNGTLSVSVASGAFFTLVSDTGSSLPSVSISANPTSVTTGQSSTITWSAANATACTASGAWSGSKATSGTQTLTNLQTSGTYTLTCTGPAGSANQSVLITVNPPAPAPTVSLSASPTTVSAGGSSTLTWSSTNASSCTASGAWSGAKAISGSQVLSNLSATGTYTLACTGSGGSANASATITVTPVTGAVSLFTTQTPVTNTTDGRTYELGMRFTSSQAGTITAIRYYRAANEPSVTHTGRIWSATGTQLASVVFGAESASGWQQANLSTPLTITANTTYVVSVNVGNYYVYTQNGFQNAITNGPLTGLAGPSNGVYGDSGTFPSGSWNSTNYFRDVVFVPNSTPTNYNVTPSGSNVTINPSGVQSVASGSTASFTVNANSGYTRSSTVTGTCAAGTWNGSVYTTGAITSNCTVGFSATVTPVNYSVTPSGTNVSINPSGVQTVASGSTVNFTVTANTGYTRSSTVTGTCAAGTWNGNVYTTGAITANCTVIFSATANGSSYSIFTTQTPAIPNEAEGRTYELGMKFTSNQAGTITGIRYYKSSNETAGGHTGRIWSSTGTVLATVTFSGETASGWQTAPLSTPLAITAGTTYVVSVNIKTHYPATNGGLATAITNGPLTALAGPSNGVYGDSGTFPTLSWDSSNYFRDVVFVPSAR